MSSMRFVSFLGALTALSDTALGHRPDSIEVALAATEVSEAPFRFQKGLNPLVTFPVTLQSAQGQTEDSDVHSMRRFGDKQVMRSLNAVMTDAGSWNEGDEDGVYPRIVKQCLDRPQLADGQPDDVDSTKAVRLWKEFLQVCFLQKRRQRGWLTETLFPTHPLFAAGQEMHSSAQLVRADFPTLYPTELVKRWLTSDEGFTLDQNIFNLPQCGNQGTEFVNGAVALGGIIGWAVQTVSPVCFATKWHCGRARPEELAWSLYTQQSGSTSFQRTALKVINQVVKDKTLSKAEFVRKFTAYDEGSPFHPSYPAMHSAASSISAWAEIVGNLTETQRNEARLLDFSVAFLRTVAGVHYASDNRAGLTLGQETVRANLPQYLADAYGCSEDTEGMIKEYVEDKLKRIEKIDWAEWSPEGYNPPYCNDGFATGKDSC